jgi:hypothetical protein
MATAAHKPVPFLVSPELREFADRILTSALTVSQWAAIYRSSPKRMLARLRRMKARGEAWDDKTTWQIPLLVAPDRYLIDVGLLQPVVSRKLAIELVDALELIHFGKN